VYEYNGSGASANYSANLTSSKSTLAAEPTIQASAVTFSNVSATGFTISWTKGQKLDGSATDNSLVVVKASSAVDGVPSDGTSYTASLAFGSGTQITSANYVVYRATLSTITITGLTEGQTYHVAVYAYNGTAGSGLENYLTSSPATGSQTAQTPTFYSKSTGLSPSNLSSWVANRDGTGDSPTSFTANASNFVIQNGHTLTTTIAFSLGTINSKLQIENGGILSAGHAISIASGAIFQIDNGGKYSQTAAITMSTIFGGTESFAPNSDFEYLVNPNSTATPSSPGYGNLTINVTTGSTALTFNNQIPLSDQTFHICKKSIFRSQLISINT
jgi:hypothetical protein